MTRPTLSGFTMVRNAVKFDYPVIESITSILPLVDEFIVNCGDSEDNTTELIQNLDSPHAHKIRIIEHNWDPRFKEKSRILAMQTNLAMYECTGDWCFYIQADEVFHENSFQAIRESINNYHSNRSVEGLLVDYLHFFGSHDFIGDSYQWYRKEVRIIRNFIGITSWKDAQGFRLEGKKLRVKETGGQMFHYGWVRPPEKMAAKVRYHEALHHQGRHSGRTAKNIYTVSTDPKCLRKFSGQHPSVMENRLQTHRWDFNPKAAIYRQRFVDFKRRFVNRIGKLTGWYPGEYKNYKLV